LHNLLVLKPRLESGVWSFRRVLLGCCCSPTGCWSRVWTPNSGLRTWTCWLNR